ncbi:MAG: hypothetical protein HY870_07645 [Chloroflexi bacterium]|nr:hypothetical protein [Chloroflexota bacterium]
MRINGTQITLLGLAFAAGALIVWILISVVGAKPSQVTVGPISFGVPSEATSASTTTDIIAGKWTGTIRSVIGENFSTQIDLSLKANCTRGNICGTYSAPSLGCFGDLLLKEIDSETFVFIEHRVGDGDSCATGGYEHIYLVNKDSLSWAYSNPGESPMSSGILKRQ